MTAALVKYYKRGYLSIFSDLGLGDVLEGDMASITDPDASVHHSKPSFAKHRPNLIASFEGIVVEDDRAICRHGFWWYIWVRLMLWLMSDWGTWFY